MVVAKGNDMPNKKPEGILFITECCMAFPERCIPIETDDQGEAHTSLPHKGIPDRIRKLFGFTVDVIPIRLSSGVPIASQRLLGVFVASMRHGV